MADVWLHGAAMLAGMAARTATRGHRGARSDAMKTVWG